MAIHQNARLTPHGRRRLRASPSQVLPDDRQESAIAFLQAALAYDASLGGGVARVMTDNGSCYRAKAFAKTCRRLELKHLRTRPYTPRTNGKAERFIQTALREWLYGKPYASSAERANDMPAWLHWYNHHRPHAGIRATTPASRLNNLLGNNN